MGAPDADNGIHARFNADTLPDTHGPVVLTVHVSGAVQKPELREKGAEGRIIDIHGVFIVGSILGKNRHKNGIEHQKQEDPCGDHRGLVLAEPNHGVGKKAPGLGLKLPVVKLLIFLHESKLLGRNPFVHHISHRLLPPYFLEPMRMRGSIKP